EPTLQAQARQVRAQYLERPGRMFHKDCAWRPAAEGLNTNRTGARIEIKEVRTFHTARKHVEEGLAQPVAGGPCGESRRGLERPRAQGSGDDAHRTPAYRTSPGQGASTIAECEDGHYRWAGGWAWNCACTPSF